VHRGLLLELVKRELAAEYRGAVLGLLWLVLTPLLLLGVYSFAFGVVLQVRWGRSVDAPADFALVAFASLSVFWIFSESVGRAHLTILQNAGYVKRSVFPLEILPWASLGAALARAALSLSIFTLFHAIFRGLPPWTALLTPLVLLPLVLLSLGLCWFLASLGVYLRDIGPLVGIFVTGALFLSPVFYPASAVPDAYRALVSLNPIAFAVEQARGVLLFGDVPDWGRLALHALAAWGIAWLGFLWFARTRRGFADVL
jgi:lipopolysaccharide transport system permease protein